MVGHSSGNVQSGLGVLWIRSAALDETARVTLPDAAPAEPPERRRADPIAGEFVTETFDYDGGRQVTVYVPPDPPEAIVFAGDGQMISQWGGFLEAADVPSTMIVGAHRVADETLRLHEYSPGFDPRTVCRTREVFRRGRRCVGAVAFRGNSACRAHGGVRCFGGWGARARHWASTSGPLRRDLLSLARRGVPAT